MLASKKKPLLIFFVHGGDRPLTLSSSAAVA
jgi:hypothetical protein